MEAFKLPLPATHQPTIGSSCSRSSRRRSLRRPDMPKSMKAMRLSGR